MSDSVEKCWGCGRDVPTSDEVSVVEDQLGWDYFDNARPGYTHTTYYENENYTLLATNTNIAHEEQGETYNVYVVVRRESTGSVFKKLGHGDSYGNIRWFGLCFPVEVRQVMVPSWEVVS